jgi:hypothetical protein
MAGIGLLDFFRKERAAWMLSKAVCKRCPVRRECLEYALEGRLVHGVWGMLDPLELRFALGRDASGEIWTYARENVKCVYCRGNTEAIRRNDHDDFVTRQCTSCGFSWERAERPPKRRRRTAQPRAVDLTEKDAHEHAE